MTPCLPLDDLSTTVSPRDDLWGWVNDEWLRRDPIPADRSRYGLSDEKRARIAGELDAIVRAAGEGTPTPTSPARPGTGGHGRTTRRPTGGDHSSPDDALRTLARLATDLPGRERAGVGPVATELRAVDAVRTAADVLRTWGALQRTGVTGPFSVHVIPREDDAERWQLSLFQAGLTLPAPGLCLRLRDELEDHATTLFAAVGLPAAGARTAVALELAVARASWPVPEGDSDSALDNPTCWADHATLAGVDLRPYAEGLAVPAAGTHDDARWNVCQPSYAQGLGRLLAGRPVEEWRDYLRWRVLSARAAYLTPRLAEVHARFHDCVVAGQPDPTPAWRRTVDVVQQHLPMDLARAWADRHVSPARCRRTAALAEDLRAQLRTTLRECEWLGETSTRLAVEKLDRIVLNVGVPDRWPTVGRLDAVDLPDAVRQCARHAHDEQLALLDGPVDRRRWGPPPFVVNTFYQPYLNQVLVEGASLPPDDVLDDRAVLAGQYASIIGHELGHAFDSRGASRDPLGRLRPWWSDDERAAFTARADAVAAQVHGYRPRGVDDATLDGARVGFECVAELIGLQLAWDTYVATTSEEERAERVGGLTGPERFFAAKAYGRRAADRPRTARNRLAGDVHPPFEVFANLARNLDAFHDTFGTRPGDGMWLAPEDRVRIF